MRRIERRADAFESKSGIQVLNHGVLGGWQVRRNDLRNTAATRSFDHDVEDFLFELAAEDATAHHPGIDFELVTPERSGDHEHRADYSIITETVAQANPACERARSAGAALKFVGRIAASRRRELIGF